MIKKLIGTGITDNNGRVALPFQGEGKGMVPFMVECEDISSNILDVCECTFLDRGVTGSSNYESFSYNPSYIQPVVDENGTIVLNTDTESTRVYSAKDETGGYNVWNAKIIVEVDIVSANNKARFQLYQNGNNYSNLNLVNDADMADGGHIKVVYDGEYVDYYFNHSSSRSFHVPRTLSNFQTRFSFLAGGTVKYKNFRIYPY